VPRSRTHSTIFIHTLDFDFEASLCRTSPHRPPEKQPRCKRSPKTSVRIAILIHHRRLIPKADRKKIHEYLFREGVMVAKKDFNQPKHGEIDTKNLYVCVVCHTPCPIRY
jgi:hypothetical protein